MAPNDDEKFTHRLRVKLLFGLFEADASGTIAIAAALMFFILLGAGRWAGFW